MKRHLRIYIVLAAVLFSGCSTFESIPDAGFGIEEPFLFRGRGTVRLYDMNSRGGLMFINEIIVTQNDVHAFVYDSINERPLSTARLPRAEISRVSASLLRFVTVEMHDGSTHWFEIMGGKKKQFVAVFTPLSAPNAETVSTRTP